MYFTSVIPAGGQGQSFILNKLTGPSRWPETPKLECYARYFPRGQFRRFLLPVCPFPPNIEGSGHQAGIHFSRPHPPAHHLHSTHVRRVIHV